MTATQLDCYTTSNFNLRGGQFGFGCSGGVVAIDDLTIKSWNSGTSAFDKTQVYDGVALKSGYI